MGNGTSRWLGPFACALLLGAQAASAVDPPHDATRTPSQLCLDCHVGHFALGTGLQRDLVACTGCHASQATPPLSQWSGIDQATPGTGGSSHRWDSASGVNPAYGASLPSDPQMLSRVATQGMSCAVCHDPHSEANAPFEVAATGRRHFLRYPNADGGICLQCHSSRNVASASAYTGGPQSHPVSVPLPAGDLTFHATPQDVGGGDQIDSTSTSSTGTRITDTTRDFGAAGALANGWVYFPRLDVWKQITASAARSFDWSGGLTLVAAERYVLSRTRNLTNRMALVSAGAASVTTGSVTCMTCHGVHNADSDSTTVDDTPRAGDGNLLRRSFTGGGLRGSTAPANDDACAGCHAVKAHAGNTASGDRYTFTFGCKDCHGAHGTRNVMLVKESLTSASGSTTTGVDFRTLTASPASAPDTSSGVAKDTGGAGAYDLANAVASGKGPCEACHTQTQDLAAGGGQPRFRNSGGGASGRHFTNQCLACHPHGKGFKGREPNGGSELFGQSCYPCHSYGMRSADAAALKQGTYHHVIESDAVAGFTPAATPTLAADGDKRCIQCHVDHPFGASRAANLRASIASGIAASEDHATSGPYGICLSCHTSAQVKNTVDQKSDGTTATYAIAAADFGASAHKFAAEPSGSVFKPSAGTFTAACVKCHSDGQPTATQAGAFKFGLHSSPDRRLRNPLGITTFANGGDALEERFCYRCHSQSTDASPGGGPAKATTASDWFGAVTNMSPGSTGIFAQMQKGTASVPAGPTTTTTTLFLQPTGLEDPVAPRPTAQAPEASTFATDTLYLKNVADEAPSGPVPLGYLLAAGNYDTTTFRSRFMSPIQGGTSEGGGALWNYDFVRLAQFTSPPIAAGFTWPAGTLLTLFMSTGQNYGWGGGCHLRWAAWRWNANGTLGPQFIPTTQSIYEVGPRYETLTTGTAVTFGPGDKILLELELQSINLGTGWAYCGGWWGSPSNDSRLILPNRPDGNLPEFSYTTPAVGGGTWAGRSMTPFAPSGQANETRETAATVPAGTRLWKRTSFVSPAVAIATTTLPAPWSIRVFDRQSAADANARVRYKIYGWKADDTRGPDIVPWTTWGTAPGTTTAQQAITTPAGAAVSLAAGDKIVVDLEFETLNVTTAAAGSYGLEYTYGPTALSNLVMPGSVTFAYDDRGTAAGGRHDVGAYSGVHRPNPADEDGAYIAANRHVECEDCHDPHAARAGRHAIGTNVAGPVLRGAPAVEPAFSTTNWDTASAVAYATTTVGASTPEAYVCFRCHSSYNTAIPTDPAGLAAPPWSTGGNGFTNTALEFSPYNRSGHPVLAPLSAYPNSVAPKTLATAQLVGGWTPGQTMTCTDCHNAEAASPVVAGPHGSAVRFMLTGTNRAWPYTVAGATSGTLFALGINNEDNVGSPSGNGLFCRNCHPRQYLDWSTASNAFHHMMGAGHGEDASRGIYCPNGCRDCVRCHLRVPHGGKVSRLIATTNTPPRYLVPGITPIFDGFEKLELEGAECVFSSSSYGCSRHCGVNELEKW